MFGEEAAAILLAEEAIEAPEAVVLGADVEQVDHQQIARLGPFDADRTRKVVHRAEVDVAHIVGAVVVLDEAAGPVVGLQHEIVAGVHPAGHGDVGVPAVVHHLVARRGLAEVNLDEGFGHDVLLRVDG